MSSDGFDLNHLNSNPNLNDELSGWGFINSSDGNDYLYTSSGYEINLRGTNPVNKDIVPVREQIIIISSADAVINTEAEVSN